MSTHAVKAKEGDFCSVAVEVCDGTRAAFPPEKPVLYYLRDGNNRVVSSPTTGSTVRFTKLVFNNNFKDSYTIIATVKGYGTVGYMPVKISPKAIPCVRLMLLPDKPSFDFSTATWAALHQNYPRIWNVLAGTAASQSSGHETKYTKMLGDTPKVGACMLNLLTAMDQIQLGGNDAALDYLKEICWDRLPQQDRFYCWADKSLIGAIEEAGDLFQEEPCPSVFHGDTASRSWKEAEYSEANVQFTFHESVVHPVNSKWILLEADIDYYKDPFSHFLGEVVVNWFGSMTEPAQVYKLRFNSGNLPGCIPFEPPYVIK